MRVDVTYESSVIRETAFKRPELLEGEKVSFEGHFGVPVSIWLVAIPIMFIPPIFVLWSLLWIGVNLFLKNRQAKELWVTNKRIVLSIKAPFRDRYTNISVPFQEITQIRRTYDGFLGVIDRMFGIAEVIVATKGGLLNSILVTELKHSSDFIKAIKDSSNIPIDGT